MNPSYKYLWIPGLCSWLCFPWPAVCQWALSYPPPIPWSLALTNPPSMSSISSSLEKNHQLTLPTTFWIHLLPISLKKKVLSHFSLPLIKQQQNIPNFVSTVLFKEVKINIFIQVRSHSLVTIFYSMTCLWDTYNWSQSPSVVLN